MEIFAWWFLPITPTLQQKMRDFRDTEIAIISRMSALPLRLSHKGFSHQPVGKLEELCQSWPHTHHLYVTNRNAYYAQEWRRRSKWKLMETPPHFFSSGHKVRPPETDLRGFVSPEATEIKAHSNKEWSHLTQTDPVVATTQDHLNSILNVYIKGTSTILSLFLQQQQ